MKVPMAMKRILLITIMIFNVLCAYPQYYVFDSIPEILKKRADAVVRSEQCIFTIEKPGNAVMKVRKAITLLNEDADEYRYLSVGYNNFLRISSMRGTIYDQKGKIIKVLGTSDIIDMSAVSGGDFYSDERVKRMYFPLYKYPYTIEYEYEVSFNSLMSYPSWKFQDSPDVSVQRSGVQIVLPQSMNLRYYEEYLKNKVDSTLLDGKKIYTWQEENLPAYHAQDLSIRPVYHSPAVYTSPLVFEYNGLKGSMSSWKELGDWFYEINRNRDALPEEEKSAIKEAVKGITDQTEIVRKVYEYMQSKTRYVSIQIGIGGFKTAEAASVAKNGFGDCKALVNYTSSLLKILGINSYFALASASSLDDINPEIIDNQFNHVILCVPVNNDSVWLECTSKTYPAGYLGVGTAGKHVLLLTPQGGKLVRTPAFQKEKNYFVRSGSLYMNVFGAVSGKLKNSYHGYNYGLADTRYSFESEDDIKKDLYSRLRFNDFTIGSATFKETKQSNPAAELGYDINIRNFGSLNGQRIYFNPGISIQDYLPKVPAELEIQLSEVMADSIAYTLPLNFKIEYLPENVKVESEFGKFIYTLEPVKDKIIFRRVLELNKNKIQPDKYESLRSFIETVASADRQKIILVRYAGS